MRRSAQSLVRRACISSHAAENPPENCLRRSIQALAEGRDPGDLTTLEDPTALDQIRVQYFPSPRPLPPGEREN